MEDKIVYCQRCLYTNKHPLGLIIDNEGVCSGCRIHEEKDTLNWRKRWDKLKEIVGQYRTKNKQNYDCIVPVSGANDSYYIVHLVKNCLGLNPLLVTYNKYFNTPLGIWNLANLRIKFNCDIIFQNVNPISVKKITRTTFREFGSIYWHCLAGQTVFPVQTAVNYGIPLIIWGAHQGLEQVGMYSHEHEVEMTRRYRKDHDLFCKEADDLLTLYDTLNEEDIWQYRYPDDFDLKSKNIRGIYLGNYVRWDPKAQHDSMVEIYGYRGARFSRTFDTYDHVDCYNFMDLHDYLKQIKHGYSKVTDHACREIRHGRLNKKIAIKLVKYYENKPLLHTDKFCEWLDLKPESLTFLLGQHLNSTKCTIINEPSQPLSLPSMRPSVKQFEENKLGFQSHAELNNGEEHRYITIGKGYP